ncbi:MAG: DUF4214 domain-containing protein [Halothiobacillaceae bacterium]|nr:DUF4214 domain-containing protein [Halothiobacillaceae bacterium]
MKIMHITELFALDDEAFIQAAYRCLLNREPDEHGLAYYLGRLSIGYGKAGVIAQLAQSPECRPHDAIKGLKKLIADERRAGHWFWGAFGRSHRWEKTLQSGIAGLAQIDQRLVALQGAVLTQAQQFQSANKAPRLPAEIVRQAFIEILGREPENEDVVKTHAKSESLEALRETLLNSEEFQSRVAALPEYARTILMRHLQAQRAQHGE